MVSSMDGTGSSSMRTRRATSAGAATSAFRAARRSTPSCMPPDMAAMARAADTAWQLARHLQPNGPPAGEPGAGPGLRAPAARADRARQARGWAGARFQRRSGAEGRTLASPESPASDRNPPSMPSTLPTKDSGSASTRFTPDRCRGPSPDRQSMRPGRGRRGCGAAETQPRSGRRSSGSGRTAAPARGARAPAMQDRPLSRPKSAVGSARPGGPVRMLPSGAARPGLPERGRGLRAADHGSLPGMRGRTSI